MSSPARASDPYRRGRTERSTLPGNVYATKAGGGGGGDVGGDPVISREGQIGFF